MQIELSNFLEHLWPAVRARVGFKNEFEKTTLKTMHWAENNYLCLLFVVSLSFKCFWVDYASVYKISKSQESIFKSFEGPSPASFSFIFGPFKQYKFHNEQMWKNLSSSGAEIRTPYLSTRSLPSLPLDVYFNGRHRSRARLHKSNIINFKITFSLPPVKRLIWLWI